MMNKIIIDNQEWYKTMLCVLDEVRDVVLKECEDFSINKYTIINWFIVMYYEEKS